MLAFLLKVIACLQLDLASASRAVDIGPSADSPEAAPFRQFWGERSEMRRFQVLLTTESSSHQIPCKHHKRWARCQRSDFSQSSTSQGKYHQSWSCEGQELSLPAYWCPDFLLTCIHRPDNRDSVAAGWQDLRDGGLGGGSLAAAHHPRPHRVACRGAPHAGSHLQGIRLSLGLGPADE